MTHILSWNCRGLGSIPAGNALRRVVINERPGLVFLQETKLKHYEMDRIRMKIHFKNMIAVDCAGEGRKRSGGLALLWKDEWDVEVLSFSLHHIDTKIRGVGEVHWRFTGLYGWPEGENKSKTGDLMRQLREVGSGPWVCGGDMNLLMWSNEKQGGGEFNYEEAAMFREAVEYCELEDVSFTGYPFTWSNNRGGLNNLQERLDRFLVNPSWKEMYGSSFVSHLDKRRSDHVPIILTLRSRMTATGHARKYRKIFRFEEMWTRENSCAEVIEKTWVRGKEAMGNLARTARGLREWNKTHFGEFAREMRMCTTQMHHLMEAPQTDETIAHMRALDSRMDELERREEIFWKQRSRQDWINHGDRNTKFFHGKAKQRVERNTISAIRDEAGQTYEDEQEIMEVFITHFSNLFTANNNVEMAPVLDRIEKKVADSMVAMLTEPFQSEEVVEALNQMHPTKAPGPDGMCALFYQKYWDIVGPDVITTVLDILNNGSDISALNQTHIVLIPKKKICDSPADYRPISLCNVLYKIVSKVLANRLKKVLPDIIHDSQSGFVPGRLITDNILVAYECFHYLRKKKTGKMGYLGLKLDMSKAYDRVEWDFLDQMMKNLGFPEKFVELIMACVRSPIFSLLINGQPTRHFTPSRGLRQGDPLSPFLFIICAEGLSTLLRDAEAKKEIHGIKIGKKVDPISHLLFADDSLLFIRAHNDEVEKVLEILSTYEAASGQKLNMEKSEVSFSRNIEQEKQDELQMKLNFKAVEGHEKYLGLPTYIGGSKKRIFQIIQERVRKKLKGWKEMFLSFAGREVLIKAIAQAIPTYAMQCFAIPVSILEEIEQVCRNFFWGQRKEERKIPWVAWEKTCLSKDGGGLGMRNLRAFNKALLAKQAWRILTNPNSLMAKTLRQKYFPNSEFLSVKVSPLASFTWKSILSARELLSKGLKKIVGDGKTTDIRKDPWVPSLPNLKIMSYDGQEVDGPQMVSDLLEDRRWDFVKLNLLFSERERHAILNIPLPRYPDEDRWAWRFTKNGDFAVRSAYYVECDSLRSHAASPSSNAGKAVWRKLWKARIPPKIQHFGWRALHGGIPVTKTLGRRGMVVDSKCMLCGESDESVTHALALCPEAQAVWMLSPLRLKVDMREGSNLMDWCLTLVQKFVEVEWWEIFWSLLWGIWLRRNAWTFNQRRIHPHDLIEKALGIVGEVRQSKEGLAPKATSRRPVPRQWKPPPVGWYKVNADAAIFSDEKVGLGGVVRDEIGEVVAATCVGEKGCFEVDAVEAMAARHAVFIALEAGFSNIILETDCLKLATHLSKKQRELSSFGNIVNDILLLVSSCNAFSVSHVGREGNWVAHHLAHGSLNYGGMRVWLEEAPDEVMQYVMADLALLSN